MHEIRKNCLGLIVAVTLLLWSAGPMEALALTVTINEDRNASEVYLKAGDHLEICLEGNPTTGFTWMVDDMPAQDILAESDKPIYKAARNIPGSGGTFTFKFKAAGEGKTDLNLVYRRVFEKDVPPARRFHVTIIVK